MTRMISRNFGVMPSPVKSIWLRRISSRFTRWRATAKALSQIIFSKKWRALWWSDMKRLTGFIIRLPRLVIALLLNKPYRRHVRSYWLNAWKEARRATRALVMEAQHGELSLALLFMLGVRRLEYARSRTAITAGAIAIGAGAIVFLVSFGYGLQAVVTNRLVKPYSMKLADVQTGSTALQLDAEAKKTLTEMTGVVDVSASVSLAGLLTMDNSKTDVVVVGARSKFLEYVYVSPLQGRFFSEQADAAYTGNNNDMEELVDWLQEREGEVAGVATEAARMAFAQAVHEKEIDFRIADDVYVPMRQEPKISSEIIGYIRGSVVNNLVGKRVWGSEYLSASIYGRVGQDTLGSFWGEWLKTTSEVWKESAPQVYLPVVDGQGEVMALTGYLTHERVHVISSEEIRREKLVNQVLGLSDEASRSASASGDRATNQQSVVTDSTDEAESNAALAALLAGEQVREATQSAAYAKVEVEKLDGKELLISSGLLRAWDLSAEKILGQKVDLAYILSGNLISGLTGRAVSSAYAYEIVGVVNEEKPMVYAPLSDLESMGVKRYSVFKIVAESTEALTGIREKIEALGFTTQSLVDTLVQVDKLFTVMRFVLALVGMIALVVAVFGMINTLTVSLLERTREVGVMKTMGTTDRDIVKMFLVESVLIGFLGGLVGILVGLLLGAVIDGVLWFWKGSQSVDLFRAPLGFLGAILLLSLVVGLITGVYPALRAKKISALDALRYE